MIETPEANLVAGMRWFQTTWTMRFNRHHRLSGHALRKGDGRKAAIAALIRRRTAAPNAWIAQALHLGHVSRVSHAVRAAQSNRWVVQLERRVVLNERDCKADPGVTVLFGPGALAASSKTPRNGLRKIDASRQ